MDQIFITYVERILEETAYEEVDDDIADAHEELHHQLDPPEEHIRVPIAVTASHLMFNERAMPLGVFTHVSQHLVKTIHPLEAARLYAKMYVVKDDQPQSENHLTETLLLQVLEHHASKNEGKAEHREIDPDQELGFADHLLAAVRHDPAYVAYKNQIQRRRLKIKSSLFEKLVK